MTVHARAQGEEKLVQLRERPPIAAAINDAHLAETLNLVRHAFGRSASAITAAEVAARRQRP